MENEGMQVCRVLVLGASKVGKTAIITQFLSGHILQKHKATRQDIYQKNIAINLSLEIEDVGGVYANDNPEVLEVSISKADIFLLVFSVDYPDSLKTVANLRDLVMDCKGSDVPIIVAENKVDLKRKLGKKHEIKNDLVTYDWQSGNFECSARMNINITSLFKILP